MKKLVLSIAVAALMIGAACSNKAADSADALKAKIENCTNADSLSIYVDQARDYARKLVAEGKIDQAKEYLAKIEPVVKEKAPALSGAFDAVNNAIKSVPGSVAEKAEDAKVAADSAVNAAGKVAAGVVDSAKTVAANAADRVSEKADELSDKAADKVQQAKDATADAAQKGADKVKDILK